MTARLTAENKRSLAHDNPAYLPALDGLRWLMVFSVACFHFWQQSWWSPDIRILGLRIDLTPWLRTGYIWVDGMLLLSGFLLFLPLANSLVAGGERPRFTGFYWRRVARILPSYLFNLLVVYLVIALPEGRYATPWHAIRDWLAHLTFTHPLFPFSNLATPLNGVLWTLGVEVQFYLIFPLVARAFWKKPLITYLGALAVAFSFRAYALHQKDTAMLVNQLPAFMDVYLNGFLAAWAYAALKKRLKGIRWQQALISLATVGCVLLIAWLILGQSAESGVQALRTGQLLRRFPLSVLLSLVFLGVSLGLRGMMLLLGNPVSRFLAAISFQFYMWHQMVAVQMRRWGFPKSQAPQPHMVRELSWQIPYVLLAFGISLTLAILTTYLIERPAARLILNKTVKRRKQHA